MTQIKPSPFPWQIRNQLREIQDSAQVLSVGGDQCNTSQAIRILLTLFSVATRDSDHPHSAEKRYNAVIRHQLSSTHPACTDMSLREAVDYLGRVIGSKDSVYDQIDRLIDALPDREEDCTETQFHQQDQRIEALEDRIEKLARTAEDASSEVDRMRAEVAS